MKIFVNSLVTSLSSPDLCVTIRCVCVCVGSVCTYALVDTHCVCVFVYIFMKESVRRAGMCLISCGRPAVWSLRDPSEVSAFPGHRRSPWVTDIGSGRRQEEQIAVNMCHLTRRCLSDEDGKIGKICQSKGFPNGN